MQQQDYQSTLDNAELLFDAETCHAALRKMAAEITVTMKNDFPLVLPIMGGAVVFAGQLLPLLRFPLDFDYAHVSRYGDKLVGGSFEWTHLPKLSVENRHILILDDILDEGHTMAAMKEKVLQMGAKSCRCAVFANKLLPHAKPIAADFVGLNVPNRYVFGFGMDVSGAWRNLPEIYALRENE